ncbi:MAG: helix-turn-helix domain-containing protein [Daejeonella sp.]|uniref:helix-turn-helix domain-containing protein n=1 Tax=Daejeonella sp. TaxID=2805397 RepID=UPI0027353449|nr:helix-turn-helix domain-containing protein [Daejeonella sp.]MDP3467059.1 helix-turn-helix domain-containing protein [Daejeonella sp.]
MDQGQIFQKLMELEKGQKRIQRALDALLERGGPKKWLDTCDMKEMFHISKSTLYRLKKDEILIPVKLGKKDLYKRVDVEKAMMIKALADSEIKGVRK